MPQAPAGVAGVFDFRGTPVPVVDLSVLVSGRPSARCLSTRLLVVAYADAAGAPRPLALVVEHATRTLRRDPTDFVESGITNQATPYLGRVTHDAGGLVQWVDVRRLLPAGVRDVLFTTPVETRWPTTSKAC